jgi:uncharacterized protein YkwD
VSPFGRVALASVVAFAMLGCARDPKPTAPPPQPYPYPYGYGYGYGYPPYGYPYTQGYPQQPYAQQPYPQPPYPPQPYPQYAPYPPQPQPPLAQSDPAVDDVRQYTLYRINQIRAQFGRGALALDPALVAFAQDGSVELAADHRAHQHFRDRAGSCGCRVMAENQGDPRGWMEGPPRTQVDQILDSMMREGPGGGHYENILDARWRRMGVGAVNPGGALYFTNDFGP